MLSLGTRKKLSLFTPSINFQVSQKFIYCAGHKLKLLMEWSNSVRASVTH